MTTLPQQVRRSARTAEKVAKSSEQREAAADEGDTGRQTSGEAPQDQNEDTQTNAEAQPFKKLGDALERWHRQQTKIQRCPRESREAPRAADGGRHGKFRISAPTR